MIRKARLAANLYMRYNLKTWNGMKGIVAAVPVWAWFLFGFDAAATIYYLTA